LGPLLIRPCLRPAGKGHDTEAINSLSLSSSLFLFHSLCFYCILTPHTHTHTDTHTQTHRHKHTNTHTQTHTHTHKHNTKRQRALAFHLQNHHPLLLLNISHSDSFVFIPTLGTRRHTRS